MPIIANDNIQVNANKPIDSRSGIYSAGAWRPYSSTTEANTTVISSRRSPGVPIWIGTSSSDMVEYQWIGGTADGNLVKKGSGARAIYLNVLDYGADPTGTNSSSAAINAAITEAATTRAGVFIPEGTYKISTSINWHYLVPIMGAGKMSTILKASSG